MMEKGFNKYLNHISIYFILKNEVLYACVNHVKLLWVNYWTIIYIYYIIYVSFVEVS